MIVILTPSIFRSENPDLSGQPDAITIRVDVPGDYRGTPVVIETGKSINVAASPIMETVNDDRGRWRILADAVDLVEVPARHLGIGTGAACRPVTDWRFTDVGVEIVA